MAREARADAVDWPTDPERGPQYGPARYATKAAGAALSRLPAAPEFAFEGLGLARHRLAAGSVSTALDLLCRGRVAVTDRLHGHILCTLLGVPHVLLDNSYGKLRRFHDAWTSDSPLTRIATSAAEAEELALSLLASTR
jgi:pyruvyl transferase EpsO